MVEGGTKEGTITDTHVRRKTDASKYNGLVREQPRTLHRAIDNRTNIAPDDLRQKVCPNI